MAIHWLKDLVFRSLRGPSGRSGVEVHLRNDDGLPRIGERLRLQSDFDISSFSRDAQVILTALKTYGRFVADNGIEWAISSTPDPRMPNVHGELRRVTGADFEVTPEGFPRPEQLPNVIIDSDVGLSSSADWKLRPILTPTNKKYRNARSIAALSQGV